MIKKTVEKIEKTIKKTDSINTKKKRELIRMLTTLKSEVAELSKTHNEQAQSIAGFTGIAAYEATRKQKAHNLVELSLDGLSSSVEGFEVSHPKLVATVNNFCLLLSRIGI